MTLFKSYTFTWYQIAFFKMALLAIGIIVGAHWNVFFSRITWPLALLALMCSIYIAYISSK